MEGEADAQTRKGACLQPPSWKLSPSLQLHVPLFPAQEPPPGPGTPSPPSLREHSGRFTELIYALEALSGPTGNPVSQTHLVIESHLLPVFSLERMAGNWVLQPSAQEAFVFIFSHYA